MIYCKLCGADLPPNKKIRNNKQIKIEELIPYMKKGWVACDKDGTWVWFNKKPVIDLENGMWFGYKGELAYELNKALNIAPAKDWIKSLKKVGGK